MHAVRAAARPKLSLAVPAVTVTASPSTASGKKPSMPALVIPQSSVSASTAPALSPLTPTARNTQLNARSLASYSGLAPASAAVQRPGKKGVAKRVSFASEQNVTLVSPCPSDYYGDWVKMGREERRWGSR